MVNGSHFSFLNNVDNLVIGLKQPTNIAKTQRKEMIDDLTLPLSSLLALHIVMMQKEGVILFLKQDILLEKALFEEAVIFIKILKHLHALISHWLVVHGVLF